MGSLNDSLVTFLRGKWTWMAGGVRLQGEEIALDFSYSYIPEGDLGKASKAKIYLKPRSEI